MPYGLDLILAAGASTVPDVSLLWAIPFVALLLCIAIVPLIDHHFWEHRYPWFAAVLGLIPAAYYLLFHHDPAVSRAAWLIGMEEYASFILLLGSLYIVSGGVLIELRVRATPALNTLLLGIGAVLSNFLGTTGAAMLLIRPFMRMNAERLRAYHVVFFIFIVANVGGSLTPIGDPPLFMGFLRGIPFFWVAGALWPVWLGVVLTLLVIFFTIDTLNRPRVTEKPAEVAPAAEELLPARKPAPMSIRGGWNFAFIGLILVAVFRPSLFPMLMDGQWSGLPLSREILLVIAASGSLLCTPRTLYTANQFTYGPIREVAILFAGIFSAMVPALNYLQQNASKLPLETPGQYYLLTGALSSALDNAPTYVVFLEARQAQVQAERGGEIGDLQEFLGRSPPGTIPPLPPDGSRVRAATYDALMRFSPAKIRAGKVTESDIRIAMMLGDSAMERFLIAISLGAVFFGACTYIGNGPNLMVRSIAESAGLRMPSFFGYVVRYVLPILVPIYLVVWVVCF